MSYEKQNKTLISNLCLVKSFGCRSLYSHIYLGGCNKTETKNKILLFVQIFKQLT